MHRRATLTAMLTLAALAGAAGAGRAAEPDERPAARLRPESLLSAPEMPRAPAAKPARAAPTRAERDDEPAEDLPPRPARLRFKSESAGAVSGERLRQVEAREPAKPDAPPSLDGLFEYLSDTRPRRVRPDDDDADGGDTPRTSRLGRDRDGSTGRVRGIEGEAPRGGGSSGGSGGRFGLIGRSPDGLFCGEREFEQFAAPVSAPFTFEDPRSTTGLRLNGLYQTVPSGQPDFRGGDIWYFGGQARLAFTDRLSLVVSKLGVISVNPGAGSVYGKKTGLSELWLTPKWTFYRDPEGGTVAATGVTFQVPIGSAGAFQDTGSLSITPFLSAGQALVKTRLGGLNALANAGYSISTNHDRSDYFYASGQLSFDVQNKHKFFPLFELNYAQVTTNGPRAGDRGRGARPDQLRRAVARQRPFDRGGRGALALPEGLRPRRGVRVPRRRVARAV